MSRWFRHYAGMMRDDKLVRAAMRSKQSVERVVWIWGAILESAAEVNDAGRYELDVAEVAYFLRADEADVASVEAALSDLDRVASGVVVNWGKRQYQSDRSAPRQAAYRERKRHGDGRNNASDGDVTSPDRHRYADVTHHRQRTDTDTKPNGLAAASAAPEPIGEDPKTKLFRVGKTALVSWGIAEKRTGSLIGQWLKAKSDPVGLLAAIQYARDQNVADPVAYVSSLVHAKEPKNGQYPRNGGDLARELAAEVRERETDAGLFRPPDAVRSD